MKIVLDTNVILDVLANREPFADKSEAVLNLTAKNNVQGAVTANSITDIAYLLRKQRGIDVVRPALTALMELLDVISVKADNCIGAFDLETSDYEDALLAHCAKSWRADFIVTRNQRDFENSPVPALDPVSFLQMVKGQEQTEDEVGYQ